MTRAFILVLAVGVSSLVKPFVKSGFPLRAHAYLISKRAAKKLLSSPPVFDIPVDHYLREYSQLNHSGDVLIVGKVLQPVFRVSGRASTISALGR